MHSGQAGLIPWAITYLEHHFTASPAEFHWELADLVCENDSLVVAAPRGHAKTTVLALAFVLYQAACYKEPFTLIVSDTGTQAEQRTSDLFAELLENDQLVKDYPHLALPDQKTYREQRAKRTTRDFITVGGLRFTGAGAAQSLRGMKTGNQRPSLIIVDDLENDESVRTPEQRAKLKDWFTKSLMNLPGSDGARFIVIGTVLHRSSLLSWLLSDEQKAYWEQRLYRAYKDDGGPLWPDAWSAEKLEVKRGKIGSKAFSSEFMNEPVDEGSTLWKEAWLNANRRQTHPELTRLAVALDPSASGTGDTCGIVAGGVSHDGHGYTLEDNTLQASPSKWARVALETYWRLEADYIVAEKNQGGEMITQTLRAALKPGEVLPTVKLVHAARGKVTRAEPIATLDEQGKLHIVGSLPKLEDELCSWTPGMASPGRMDAYVWLWSELMLEPELVRKPTARSVQHRTAR